MTNNLSLQEKHMKIRNLIPITMLAIVLGVFPAVGQADLKADTERLNRYLDQLRNERIERERQARQEREKQELIERERQHQASSVIAEQQVSTNDTGDRTVSASTQLVRIETDVFDISIDTRGAVIKSVKLKKYPVDVEHPEEHLELIHSEFNSVYVIQNGLRSQDSPAPTHHHVFQVGQGNYTLKEGEDRLRVPFTWLWDGIEVTKVYEFGRGAYLINVDHQVNNRSDKPWTGTQYRQIQRSRPLETSEFLYTYTGAVVYNNEVKYQTVDFDYMEEQAFRLNSSGGWVAMIQHNFLSAWIAGEQENNLMYSIANQRVFPKTYTIGIRSFNMKIPIGSEGRFNSQLYIGPKLVSKLKAISTGLELTVDQ
jgi:YidC/Oxa1 family membrane protein insertase